MREQYSTFPGVQESRRRFPVDYLIEQILHPFHLRWSTGTAGRSFSGTIEFLPVFPGWLIAG
jgi:hypothetical protein